MHVSIASEKFERNAKRIAIVSVSRQDFFWFFVSTFFFFLCQTILYYNNIVACVFLLPSSFPRSKVCFTVRLVAIAVFHQCVYTWYPQPPPPPMRPGSTKVSSIGGHPAVLEGSWKIPSRHYGTPGNGDVAELWVRRFRDYLLMARPGVNRGGSKNRVAITRDFYVSQIGLCLLFIIMTKNIINIQNMYLF